jgi:DNA repair protein RadC
MSNNKEDIFLGWTAGELAMTYNRAELDGPTIKSPQATIELLRRCYSDSIEFRESAICIGVSRANKLRSVFTVGEGGTAGCVIDPKLVFSRLLLENCSAFILSHNHPSGNTNPSMADKKLTRDFLSCGKVLDIPLLDHIIVTKHSHFSFATHDML